MSRGTAPYRCDAEGCDKQRGNDSNNWLLVWVDGGPPLPGAFGSPVLGTGKCRLVFTRWDDLMASMDGMHHVCGQNHASILLARWMSNRTLDVPSPVSDPPQIAVRG